LRFLKKLDKGVVLGLSDPGGRPGSKGGGRNATENMTKGGRVKNTTKQGGGSRPKRITFGGELCTQSFRIMGPQKNIKKKPVGLSKPVKKNVGGGGKNRRGRCKSK